MKLDDLDKDIKMFEGIVLKILEKRLLTGKNLYVIGTCGECKSFDSRNWGNCDNALSALYGKIVRDGCIHFEQKEVAK